MLARLLKGLPGWLTGNIESKAKKEIRKWVKENSTLRTFRYGFLRRFLLWGSDHPFLFSMCVGLVAVNLAYVISIKNWINYYLLSPTLNENFDLAAYLGIQWGVQATLVALVYPIVVSFIALMLQRRAFSMVALRVYILDSSVLPAGVSSIFFLLALGIQYFGAPYCDSTCQSQFMGAVLIMNCSWFTINLFLTGFFLIRTIKFVQEDEQLHAYTRVAINIILRAELTVALKQHLYINAPYSEWGFQADSVETNPIPNARMFSIGRDKPDVVKDIKGSTEIFDVHLGLLKIVVNSWCKRAKLRMTNKSSPTINFPAVLGEPISGEVILCSIENGPPLKFFEKLLIKNAFCFRSAKKNTLSLTTRKMIEELSGEIENIAELHRFSSAEIELSNMIKFHRTLLLASTARENGASVSVATIGTSVYGWSNSSFDMEWLKPYRDLGRIAVSYLDVNPVLFNKLAAVPANMASHLPPKPEKLIIDLLLIGTNLAYQLGNWWTRKADASLSSESKTFSGVIPAPLNKVYERAVVTFIGSWGHLYISIPKIEDADEDEIWASLTARTLIYAKHIDSSVELFFKAVARGDEVASKWFLEHFMKWWGNHEHELSYDKSNTFELRRASFNLAEKTLAEVKRILWDGENVVTVEQAGKALNLAIHRYWENLRIYIALVLIHNADLTKSVESMELRFAANLIKGATQFSGGNAELLSINNVESILSKIIFLIFGIETGVDRMDGLSENVERNTDDNVVSGWIYSWSGSPINFSSMKREQCILLAALVSSFDNKLYKRHELVDIWWKDINKLEEVSRYCIDLRKDILSKDFNDSITKFLILQKYLETNTSAPKARISISKKLKSLSSIASHERITTIRVLPIDHQRINDLAFKSFSSAFDSKQIKDICGANLVFEPGLITEKQSRSFEFDKTRFLVGNRTEDDSHLVESIASYIQDQALAWNFRKVFNNLKLSPVHDSTFREKYDATYSECMNFISSILSSCNTIKLAGYEPIILVGRSAPKVILQLHIWGDSPWQHKLPPGVLFRNGDLTKNELAKVYINEMPIYDFPTPNEDCFVIPSTVINSLELSGTNISTAFNVKTDLINDERLKIEISWMARFNEVKSVPSSVKKSGSI